MVEFDIDIDEIDDGREHYPILMRQNADTSNRLVNQLQPGEEAAFPIHIYFNFEKIKEDDFLDMGESSMLRYTIKPGVMQKYKTLIL